MNDQPLEEKLNHSGTETRKAENETDRRILELRIEIHRLTLELTALKEYMKAASPSFAEQFPHILEKTTCHTKPGTHLKN